MAPKNSASAESPEIRLTPATRLRFPDSSGPWQRELFELGASRKKPDSVVAAFWRNFAAKCLTALCHAAFPGAESETCGLAEIAYPGSLTELSNEAPPMPGGEYLNAELLGGIWRKLLEWCEAEIAGAVGLPAFLEQYAPAWQSVGTVFFHLGENKLDPERPFAFLATYATGLNAKGELRHKPLGSALRQYAEDKRMLARILAPLHRAAEHVPWARAMCYFGDIYNLHNPLGNVRQTGASAWIAENPG